MINSSLMNKLLGSLWPQPRKLSIEKWMYACDIDLLSTLYQNYHCDDNKKLYLVYCSFLLPKDVKEPNNENFLHLDDDQRKEIVAKILSNNNTLLSDWPENFQFDEHTANKIIFSDDRFKSTYEQMKHQKRAVSLVFNLISIGKLGRVSQIFLDHHKSWFSRLFGISENQMRFQCDLISEAFEDVWKNQNCFQNLRIWFSNESYTFWNKPMKLFIVRCIYESLSHLNAIEIARSISSDILIWKSSFIEWESSRVIHALHHRKRFPMCAYRGAPGHDKLHLTNVNLIRTTAYCSAVVLNSVGLANSFNQTENEKWFTGEGVDMKDQLELMLSEWGHRFVENPERKNHVVQVAKRTQRALIALCLEYQMEQLPTFTDLQKSNANICKLTESEINDFMNDFLTAFGEDLF